MPGPTGPSSLASRVHAAAVLAVTLAQLAVTFSLPAFSVPDAHAALGDCGQPLTAGNKPTASDALFVLRSAVGQSSCDLCVCDVNGNGSTTASDSLAVLRRAVNLPVNFNCISCEDCGNGSVDEGEQCDPPGKQGCNDLCQLCAGAAESCNGVDDDCDEQTDEGFGQQTCGIGPCEVTVDLCVAGVPNPCVPLPPQSEICDNQIDEDCDGSDCAAVPLELDEPALGVTNEATVDVSGIVDEDAASVSINGVTAVLEGGGQFHAEVPLRSGPNAIVAVAVDEDGNQGVDSFVVTLDEIAPSLGITSPPDNFVTTDAAIAVTGSLNDMVGAAFGADVTVNGVTASVEKGSFVAEGVPVLIGQNTITAVARDAVGNQKSASISVERRSPTGIAIKVHSGDAQAGMVGQQLAQPLVAEVTDDGGNPLAGRLVTFTVDRNDGTLTAGGVEGVRTLQQVTGSDGRASVSLTLGTRAGAGNNGVRASALGAAADALFCASGFPKLPHAIRAVAGENQTGVVGTPLTTPLEVVVVDEDGNPLEDVPVLFQVLAGAGHLDEDGQVETATDGEGTARAVLTLGPGTGRNNNVVEAYFPGIATLRASFVASAVTGGDPAQTALAGVVLDDTNTPIPITTVRATALDGEGEVVTETDAQGQFLLQGVGVGQILVFIDPRTSPRTEKFPALSLETVTVAGKVNTLANGPVRLPETVSIGLVVGGNADVVVPMPGVAGMTLTVFANSVTFPDTTKIGRVAINQVHLDKVPMTPPGGTSFLGPAWSIQPPGVLFDPPARVSVPNGEGLAPGSVVDLYQFDHSVNRFINIGPATVEESGMRIVSNPGFGVTRSGWGGATRTRPRNTCAASCDDGNECTADSCVDGQCSHSPAADGASCGGSGECSQSVCSGGACVQQSEEQSCDDGDPCTTDACSNGSCTHEPKTTGMPCEDGNECIDSSCNNGVCTPNATQVNGTPCNDGNNCTVNDKCMFTVCTGTPVTFDIEGKVMGADHAERLPECTVFFTASIVETNCVGTVSFEWDFGDGFSRGGANVTHEYAREGNYSPIVTARCGSCESAMDSDLVTVEIGPGLRIVVVEPFGKIELGSDARTTYEVMAPGDPFDSVEFHVRNKLDADVVEILGLPTSAGRHDVVWSDAKWTTAFPGAFANPLDGPYSLVVKGKKDGCEVEKMERRDTHFVIEALVEDAPPPAAATARVAGLEDILSALKIVLRTNGSDALTLSGPAAITVSGVLDDLKTVRSEAPQLDMLADGLYQVQLRDLRDEIGNFTDADGNPNNGIQEVQFLVELR
ncbi:MAG TPA: PKD domain-containing protein [Candidatus Binatia bacterium]|nr:PKD domain-containing protein [Candidatus Binatia bacterium]